eukprot:Skav207937  [mRNA]  locus=scaffold108:117310:119180:+ [translate_table: standard]
MESLEVPPAPPEKDLQVMPDVAVPSDFWELHRQLANCYVADMARLGGHRPRNEKLGSVESQRSENGDDSDDHVDTMSTAPQATRDGSGGGSTSLTVPMRRTKCGQREEPPWRDAVEVAGEGAG